MFSKGEIVELTITDYAFGGRGIAKVLIGDTYFVVFVDNSFPGQVVRAKIDVKRKNHAEAKLIDVINRSPDEIVSNYQEISGGPYIYVPPVLQEKVKEATTLEIFSRISGIKNLRENYDGFIASPAHYAYRNKMEYSFSCIEHCIYSGEEKDNAFALGFKRRGTWWKVENLDKPSGLFDDEWESKLINIRKFLETSHLPAWHPPKKEGFFRHLVVRKSFHSDLLLVNLVTSSVGLKQFDRAAFVAYLLKQLGNRIAGIQHTINDNVADRSKIENGSTKLLFGQAKIEETINKLRFEISMESFFQTNPRCAELLYNRAIDYLLDDPIDAKSVVLDLFCGTGTIAQLIAKRNANIRIVGVDIVAEAIKDAERNAAINKLKNVQFVALDVGKFLKENPDLEGKIAALILDPPRAGIAPKTLQKVINLGAKVLVYISCNPSTQARDTSLLIDAGYELKNYTLVDQFPHTGHIEAIAKFIKK